MINIFIMGFQQYLDKRKNMTGSRLRNNWSRLSICHATENYHDGTFKPN